jgi:hypothetical protein
LKGFQHFGQALPFLWLCLWAQAQGAVCLAPSADLFVWCGFIVLNANAPAEDKNDDTGGIFYKEVDSLFGQFPKYHMKNFITRFQ